MDVRAYHILHPRKALGQYLAQHHRAHAAFPLERLTAYAQSKITAAHVKLLHSLNVINGFKAELTVYTAIHLCQTL